MKLNDLPSSARQGQVASAAWQSLLPAACAPYRQAGRWAWHWARGKLGRDPVFKGMLERGDLPERARVVDIGCGQGLMASLLQACADLQARGGWPDTGPGAWPARACAVAYTGIELMPKDVARAQAALHALALQPQFVCGDMCSTALPASDLVVILDVLHYVDHQAQLGVLQRVRDALAQGAADTGRAGRLLLRVGDASDARGFAISQWVDHVVTVARGHRVPPTWGRPLAEWTTLLQGLGFAVRAVPQSQGTPFANVLLIADLQGPSPDAHTRTA